MSAQSEVEVKETGSTKQRKNEQVVRGKVISDKMDKTRVIEISRLINHPLYHKKIKRKKTLFVHDEKNESGVGDTIIAVACRPLSKHKSFRLRSIAERAIK